MKQIKKGVSPIISTVILIMMVIVIALIILLWSKGFIKETIEKEIAGNIKRANEYCLDVRLKPIINKDGTFGFENVGNVPIYAYKAKLTESGSGESNVIKISNENGGSVNPGFGTIIDGQQNYDSYEQVKIIPVLLGKTKNGVKEFECSEKNGLPI